MCKAGFIGFFSRHRIYLSSVFFKIRFLFIWTVTFLLIGCGSGTSADIDNNNQLDQPGNTTVKVLFIGNSYTYVNNLPDLFKQIAASKDYSVETTMVAPGGYWFSQHAVDANTLNTINSDQWDFVFLQNQSQVPGWKPADVTVNSLPHAETLADTIKANNIDTEIIYYVTWGRENGDAQNCAYYPLVCTFDGHTQALLEGYSIYQNSTGGKLALVGSAWKAVVDDIYAPFTSGDLWAADESHPDVLGSYLTASVLFATAFNQTPLGADPPGNVSDTNTAYLQQIATDTMGVY